MASGRYEASQVDPSPLGQPLTFEFTGQTAKNRFFKSAMSERLSSWDDQDLTKRGVPSKELINVYRRWGEGDYGLLMVGNTMLDYDQLEAPGNPIIPAAAPFSGERFERFKELATAAKKHGSLVHVQLSHPGRQVTEIVNPHPISPSDIKLETRPFGVGFAKPRAMEKKDFEEVVSGFAHASEYLYKAGYDGIQLHAAHGYLLAQFLAQTTNKRTDEYGGSLQNRARIIFEISDAIRARVPDKSFSIGIKINSVEFQEGGFSPEDCRDLCIELEKHGFDYVELSGGTYEHMGFSHQRESTKKREAYFLEFADLIIPHLKKTKAYVTGGLRTVSGMLNALETVHGVGIARPAAQEFDLPRKILEGKVNGALQPLLDSQDFGETSMAAGAQIRQAGFDKEPVDLSRPDHKEVFARAFAVWNERKTKDGYIGYIDLPDFGDFQFLPYGTAYAKAA
ncbi:NADH-dependent flavin oxidoreductase nadA [Cladobotryum mycophilum]|uniref:NADH-dependent flavin oxidoreductase nadA n=1 Tax=Cladobotryum mycophilum TaxID=491253 RepID=A0ABR0SVX5_9HYPO